MNTHTQAASGKMVGDIRVPRHIAIIMDGNGRWAKKRNKMRVSGHRAGVEAVRNIVTACGDSGVGILTLFAFSSENWRRPPQEVSLLMELFMTVLKSEAKKLQKNNVKLRVIGDLSAFSNRLQERIAESIELTKDNDGLILNIAANFGGRWDIIRAVKKVVADVQQGKLPVDELDEEKFSQYLSFADLPEPDLFIRTGGEQRISNFLLWHLAYSELYFTDVLWPDFDKKEFDKAILSFSQRERRFGRTSEQVGQLTGA
ncbi:MAG TPA: isoprenyl transferase [Gammaproteobacteria bacterium]|nr:isoprenyl transferase [Gammaproteobacteria bacterium]